MPKHLLLLLLCGCMEVSSPTPTPIALPPALPGDFAVALEADASTISTIFKYAGASNEISLRDPLVVAFGDNTLSLPAGSAVRYDLSDAGGTISFGSPKPIVTTKAFGLTVHPVLDRIVLRQPSHATAYARDLFGVTHSQCFELPGLAPDSSSKDGPVPSPPSQEAQEEPERRDSVPPEPNIVSRRCLPDNRPSVSVWTIDIEIQSAVSGKELPIHFDFNPDKVAFSNQRPALEWSVSGRTHRQLGWQGLANFLKAYESSGTEPAAVSVKPVLPGSHSHRCTHFGTIYASKPATVWSHTSASRGNRADHTCPVCGSVVWDIHDQR